MLLQNIYPSLAHNSWFSQLPRPLAEKLLGQCRHRHLEQGQQLHARHDLGEGLYCVLFGRIRVSNISLSGKERVLTILEPGSWFGEISLLDGQPRTHDAHAEEQTRLLVLSASAFNDLLKQHPELYRHVSLLLCQRLRASFQLIDEIGCLSVKQQLARRLLLLAENQSGHAHEMIKVSQESLAHMLSVSRQTVNKLLQELKKEGFIRLQYGRFAVEKKEQLAAYCQL